MQTVLGIDLNAEVEPLFESTVPGTVLLSDGDGPAYRAAATAKTLPTAYRRFIQEILAEQFVTKTATAEVYLTASTAKKADRELYPTFKPYQGNRNGKKKPALLEPLRQYLANDPEGLPEGMEVQMEHYWEADDRLIMRAHILGEHAVMRSDDKDLRLTPGPYYENSTASIDRISDRFGWIAEDFTPSGSLKIKGHGTAFFFAQLLHGDMADNVRGIDRLHGKLCGPVATLKYLSSVDSEDEAANRILWEYAKIGQDVLAEAQMLWLRRDEQDCAYRYLMELNLDQDLKVWLTKLNDYHREILQAALTTQE